MKSQCLASFVICVLFITTGAFADLPDNIDIGGDVFWEYFQGENIFDLSDRHGDYEDVIRAEAHLYLQAMFDHNITFRTSAEVDRGLRRVRIDPNDPNQLTGLDAKPYEIYLEEAMLKAENIAGGGFSVSLGRQFMNYGDNQFADDYNQWWGPGFILGDSMTNDPLLITQLGSYEIDPFDAVIIRHESEFTQLDLFYGRSVEDTLFYNGIDVDAQVVGLYGSYFGIDNHQLDLYGTYNEENSPLDFTGMGGTKWIFGSRAAGDITEEVAYKAELAYQRNDADDTFKSHREDADAIGAQAGLNYHPDHEIAPNVGFIYTYLQQDGAEDTMSGFSSPFEGKTYGVLAEGMTKTYQGINPFTNMHVFNVNGGVQPTHFLAWSLDLYYFLLDEELGVGNGHEDDGGVEMDTQIDYLINKDIRTFVGGGVYFPGEAMNESYGGDDDNAYFFRAGLKVRF